MRNDQDCLASCIAYVTGEPIEYMPHREYAIFKDFCLHDMWIGWLEKRGYLTRVKREPFKGIHISIYSVEGQGTIGHAVVMKRDRMLYDPYPNLPMTWRGQSIKIWRKHVV